MANFTINLSPKKISTLVVGSFSTKDEGNSFVIKLAPVGIVGTNEVLQIEVGVLQEDEIYEAFFDPGSPYLEWERAYDEVGTYGGTTKVMKEAIDLFYKNPTNGKIEASPYWQSTSLQYKNPGNFYPHGSILTKFWTGPTLGNVDEETWNKILEQDGYYRKYNPHIQPGEYFIVQHLVNIDGNTVSRYYSCKYESPLFTGGILRSKEGSGIETTYTVEIFGQLVSGIKPTDFYSKYSIGKWVYLLKNESLEPVKQEYGSSNISNVKSGSYYRLTPFNFSVLWGPDCAIDYTDAITVSSWEEMFDMVQMDGEIISIDYENDMAEVDIPGASVHELPVFYYCESSDTVLRGSTAFKPGDNVFVCKKRNTWTDAKIVGFPNEIKKCRKYLLYGSFVQTYITGVTSVTNYEGYPPRDSTNYPNTNYADTFRTRVNAELQYAKCWIYDDEQKVLSDLVNIEDRDEAINFLHDNTDRNLNYLDSNLVVNNPQVNNQVWYNGSLPKIVIKRLWWYNKGEEDQELRESDRTISLFGYRLSGGYYYRERQRVYQEIEIEEDFAYLRFTEGPSSFYEYQNINSEQSQLFFSKETDPLEEFTFEAPISLTDFPDSFEFEGMTFVRQKIVHFAHKAPDNGNDIFVQYINEAFIE